MPLNRTRRNSSPVSEPCPPPDRSRPGLALSLDDRPEFLGIRLAQEGAIQPRGRKLHLEVRHRHLHLADVLAQSPDLALNVIANIDCLIGVAGRLREEVALADVVRLQSLGPVLRMI